MADPILSDELNIKVSWLYYMEGKTQEDISTTLGLSRSKVLRILANSRQNGLVQIRVTTDFSHCVELERSLEKLLGLERAIVIPNSQTPETEYDELGTALGSYVSGIIQDNMSIGIGWGRTLTASLAQVDYQEQKNVKVISMLGGLTRVSGDNPSEFAWRFADRLSAECFLMAAPVFAPDIRTRDALLSHAGINEVVMAAKSLDLAIVTAGDLSPHSTVSQFFILEREDIASLQAAGAIGHVLCRFIDAKGQVIDHPINHRVLAIDPRDLGSTGKIVLASGGWQKYDVVRAAMKLLKPHVLVTDESVAERLIAEVKK
jgi:DNA-binding transcriptional regulator LsrR (DeoR family)